MPQLLSWSLAWAAIAGALGVVWFQAPVRAAASFLFAVTAAGLLGWMLGLSELAGSVLWLCGGGAGATLLATMLLQNLGPEETGRRRYRLRGALAVLAVLLFGSSFAGLLAPRLAPLAPSAWFSPPTSSLAATFFGVHAMTLGLLFLAFLTLLLATLPMVRRRP